jgi:Leucine-rich repeat (LRR) protein
LPTRDVGLIQFTEHLPHSTPLKELNLSNQSLSPAALVHLLLAAKRRACPSLKSLDLSHNPLGDAFPAPIMGVTPAETARQLREVPLGRGGWNLATLRLAGAWVGNAGALALTCALSEDDTALEELDLRGNNLQLFQGGEQLDTQLLRDTWERRGKAQSRLLLGPLW